MLRDVTQGCLLLRAVLVKKSYRDVAKQLDCSHAQVFRWVEGDRMPSIEMACRLESQFAIPVKAWREPASESPPPDRAA